jgi:hypothetical protein
MSGTINYLYDPNQTVWVIASCNNEILIREGLVIQLIGTVILTGQTLVYDIRMTGDAGTVPFVEDDVFATLQNAVIEYETRLTA